MTHPSQNGGDGWASVLPFDVDDPEFVRGFEAGDLWGRMKYDPRAIEQHMHGTNSEMIMRMAEAAGRTVTAEQLDDTWMLVKVDEEDWS